MSETYRPQLRGYYTEIRNATPGYTRATFENVAFIRGEPIKATAEKITETWYPTKREAQKGNYK